MADCRLCSTGGLAVACTVWACAASRSFVAHRHYACADWCLCRNGTGAVYGGYRRFVFCAGSGPQMAGNPFGKGLLCPVLYSHLSGFREFPVPPGDSLGIGQLHGDSAAACRVAGAERTGTPQWNDVLLAQIGRYVSEDIADSHSIVCFFSPNVPAVERSAGFG